MERFIPKEEPIKENEISKEKESRFEIIDIIPEKEKYPIPVLVAPGWATTPKTLEKSLKLLSEKGRRVLSLYHTRKEIVKGPLSLIRSRKEILEPDKEYSFEEIQKAFSILEFLEDKKIDKIDAVAYSEAGINVSIAASEYPEKFRNIIYVNPAGMIGKDKLPKLFGRFSVESIRSSLGTVLKSETRQPLKTLWKESLNYIIKNIPLSFKEAIAISKSDIKEMMRDLKNKGIGISIIHGEKDKLFSIEKMKEVIDHTVVDRFYQFKGGHFDIVLEPEKFTDFLDSVLVSSDENKK